MGRNRDLIGTFVFELVIVFIGVTAAFALENRREQCLRPVIAPYGY